LAFEFGLSFFFQTSALFCNPNPGRNGQRNFCIFSLGVVHFRIINAAHEISINLAAHRVGFRFDRAVKCNPV